jgi:hypothetical protein
LDFAIFVCFFSNGSKFDSEKSDLVGGLEHFLFSHILGIIIPTDPTDFHILSSYYYPKRPSFCAARLLDADTNGLVDLDEFVTGCLNLHGTAKSPLGRWLGRFPVGIETWGGV